MALRQSIAIGRVDSRPAHGDHWADPCLAWRSAEVPDAAVAALPDPAALIDDRPETGAFRIHRSIYTDPAVYEAEMDRLFETGWIYLCHDSQVRTPGDYVSTRIGRRPVFVIRKTDGTVGCFLNACSHRGAILMPRKTGSARTVTCRYHGWRYSCDGRCLTIRGEDGYEGTEVDRAAAALRPVRTAAYKGFVFGRLDDGGGDLETFLGQSRPFFDLMADQSAQGMEILKGESVYMMHANWKLQTENSADGYHVATVHRSFGTTLSYRDSLMGDAIDPLHKTEAARILTLDKISSGGYDLGGGHMVSWSTRASPEAVPLNEARTALEARLGPGKVRWMIDRGRTVTVFPNLLLNDMASTCIRTWRPLAVDLTEIETWCLAPVGESAAARRARIRKYEDFFFPASLAVPDDIAAMEGAHDGSLDGGWNELALGRRTMVAGADDAARDLGIVPVSSNPGRESETAFHGFYREWRRRLAAG
jgi:benzoate/toluate 1,2-dioxygenase alpha subunit